jgi:tryptophan-rich sensory protein
MKKTLIFLFPVIGCLFTGFIVSRYQAEALSTWYPALKKSALTPPDSVFAIVWIILYFCMGLSIGFILNRNNPKEPLFIRLFIIQLFLCILWNVFFPKEPLVALVIIVLLAYALFRYLVKTYYRANRFSFVLFVPYLLWTLFCGYLNGCIVAWN